jgi:hypothetical protein
VVATAPGSESALSPGWHAVEIDWQAASAPAAHDGRMDLWVDGQLQAPLVSLDTDESRLGFVRWGAVAGLDAGTSGSFSLDAFVSRRRTMIGTLSSFDDVPKTDEIWPFVQAVRNAELMEGCADGRFCPDAMHATPCAGGAGDCPARPLTRGEMAVFLARRLGLALPLP